MTSTDRELEEQLMQTGNRLLKHPSSVEDLLELLDQVEKFLSRVEQSPPKSMQTALSPSLKALVANELLRHSDADVKVAVASCISEITRITAPDAPYDDDQMKDVFQLIVSSFKSLSDTTSRSYVKRISILETVSKVRSCVVMLDLECDALIVEMFQHFLKAIRDCHPSNVFSSMETIMALVVEESEDISVELISPILASVKKDNEEVLPIARKLGERVLASCATKLKPYLTQAVKSLGLSLDDYSEVVASICEGTTGAAEHNDDNASGEQLADESKLVRASSEEAAQADESKVITASSDAAAEVAKESVTGEASAEEANPATDKSAKSVMSNGVTEVENEDNSKDPESLKKAEHDHHANQSENTTDTSKVETVEPDDSAAKSVETEPKPDQTVKRRGKKPNSLISSVEPSNDSQVDNEKEAKSRRKSRSKEVPISPSKDQPIEEPSADVPSENETETGVQIPSPKASADEAVNVTSPPPSASVPDEGRSKKAGRTKKKENLIQDASPSTDIVSKKLSEGTSDSDVQPKKRSEKKKSAVIANEDKTPAAVDTSKDDGGTSSDSEDKQLDDSGKKSDAKSDIENDSSKKTKKGGKRRRGRGKVKSKKNVTKSAAKADDKENVSSPKSTTKLAEDEAHVEETPKSDLKRKRTTEKEKASDTEEPGQDLVDRKVKVWWPDDRTFYEGKIDSFDPHRKKHKVVYIDGDVELLNLKKEKWEFVKDDPEVVPDGEEVAEHTSPDTSSDMHKKKKAKTSSEFSAKQKMEIPAKRGKGASSSKPKSATTKSETKSDNNDKVDSKLKDIASKSSGKSKANTGGGKFKDKSSRSGKSVDDTSKVTTKSKDVDRDTPKTSTRSKQEDTSKSATKDTPKTSAKSKGRKSNAKSSTGKVKSSSSKVEETEDEKEKSLEVEKTPKSAKGKSSGTSKAGGSQAKKSGKKRRRGA